MGVWDAVRGVLARGEDPVVKLDVSMLKRPPPGKPGRPKKQQQEPTMVERAAKPLMGDSSRPRCLNPRCKKRLKAAQEYVCDDECRELAVMTFTAVVDLLKGAELPVEDVPDVQGPKDATWRIHPSRGTRSGGVIAGR